MKKSTIILFILRLFSYLSVTILVIIHPGITVPYDHTGFLQWFVIIPLSALLAFIPAGKTAIKYFFTLLFLLPLSVWAGGFGLGALLPFCAGLLSFVITFLLFYHPRWAKAAALEPFFLVWVCFRLLALSRSGEEAAGQSMGITQFIFVWTAVVFLLHSAVVYFCLYPCSRGGARSEAVTFFLAAAAALIVILVVLPSDFVRNKVIANPLPDRMPEKISSSDSSLPIDSGSRRGNRRTNSDAGNQRQPELRGISEYDWPSEGSANRNSQSGENSRQYTVMVVASKNDPVYM